MISKEAQKFKKKLCESYVPIKDWKNIDYEKMRESSRAIALSVGPIPEGASWEKSEINGIGVERIFADESSKKIIMHIHGGSMVKGDSSLGRFMLSNLALLTNKEHCECRLSIKSGVCTACCC